MNKDIITNKSNKNIDICMENQDSQKREFLHFSTLDRNLKGLFWYET